MRIIIVALAALTLSTAFAEEKAIKEQEVPRPVINRVQKKYPAAKMTGFEREREDGKTSYEIKLSDGTKRMEVICTPDGKILAEEEQIVMGAVPEKVRQALKTNPKYGTWAVRNVERIVRDEKTDAPSYELKVAKGKAGAELVFSSEGVLTKTEELPPGRAD
jgi:hypothetical protein